MAVETIGGRAGNKHIFYDGYDNHDEIQKMIDNAVALAELEEEQRGLEATTEEVSQTPLTEISTQKNAANRKVGALESFGRRVGVPTIIAGIALGNLSVSQAHAEPAVSPESPRANYSAGTDNSTEDTSPSRSGEDTDGTKATTPTPTESPKKQDKVKPTREAKAEKSPRSDRLKNDKPRSDRSNDDRPKSEKPKGDNFITKLQKDILGDSEDDDKKKPSKSKAKKPDSFEAQPRKDTEDSDKKDEPKKTKRDKRAEQDKDFYPTAPEKVVPTEAPFEFFNKKKDSEGALSDIKPDSELPGESEGENLKMVGGKTSKQQEIEELAGQVGIGDKAKSPIRKSKEKFYPRFDTNDPGEKIIPLITKPKPKQPEVQTEPAPAPPAPEAKPQSEAKTGSRPPKVSSEAGQIIDGMKHLSPKKKEFYKNILLDVVSAAAENPDLKINKEIMIAQAIMESGWGGSTLTTQYNAYFGIKVGSWKGPVAKDQTTKEYNGGEHTIKDSFRAYGSRQESVVDYMRFINNVKKSKGGERIYQRAIDNADTPEGYAKGLKDSGYATHPSYDKDLVKLAKQQKIAQLLELEIKNHQEHNKQQGDNNPESPAPAPPKLDLPPPQEVATGPEEATDLPDELKRKYAAYLSAVGIDPALVEAGGSIRGVNSSTESGSSRGFLRILHAEAVQNFETEEKKPSPEPAPKPAPPAVEAPAPTRAGKPEVKDVPEKRLSTDIYSSVGGAEKAMEAPETVHGLFYDNQMRQSHKNNGYPSPTLSKATMGSGGCGPLVSYMLERNLTDSKSTPAEVAEWMLKNGGRVEGGTALWKMEERFKQQGGSVSKISMKDTKSIISGIDKAISEGGLVAVSAKRNEGDPNQPATKSGHYFIVAGIHPDSGEYIVLDPLGINGVNNTFKTWNKEMIASSVLKNKNGKYVGAFKGKDGKRVQVKYGEWSSRHKPPAPQPAPPQPAPEAPAPEQKQSKNEREGIHESYHGPISPKGHGTPLLPETYANATITAGFDGYDRLRYSGGKKNTHTGVDFGGAGLRVLATKAGRVLMASGGMILIKHGEEEYTNYQHVNVSVKVGDQVLLGQRIGVTNSKDNHLHYANFKEGRIVSKLEPESKVFSVARDPMKNGWLPTQKETAQWLKDNPDPKKDGVTAGSRS